MTCGANPLALNMTRPANAHGALRARNASKITDR
jgi:hypothetical protein